MKSKNELPSECTLCLQPLPKSSACSFEGEKYVWYFCGPACYEQWQTKTARWLEEGDANKKSNSAKKRRQRK